jgi:Ca2+-binding RTX toxin-like protein
VVAAVDYTLASGVFVEIMQTNSSAGTGGIDLKGNEIVQAITGNAGNNIIDGKGGSDSLTGLGGKDFFDFTTKLGAANIDTITDFDPTNDTIRLENAIFTAFAGKSGAILAGNFRSNTTGLAQDASDFIIYDNDSGTLFYDEDGIGSAAGVHFATLDKGLALTNADFVVI